MKKNNFDGEISIRVQIDDAANKENKLMATFEKLLETNDFEKIERLATYCLEKNITPYLSLCSLDWLIRYVSEEFFQLDDETDPDEAKRRELWDRLVDYLWELKGLIPRLAENIHPIELIHDFMANMKLYYETWDFSLKMYYKTYMLLHIAMGNEKEATEYFTLWKKESSDFMSDCPACELTDEVKYYSFIGQHKKAIRLAKPLLRDEITCDEVPAVTYAPVLRSLLALGKKEEVEDLLDEALMEIYDLEDCQSEYKELTHIMMVCAELEDYETVDALALDYWDKILVEATNLTILNMHMAACNNGPEFYQSALEAARRFDQRNGNQYFETILKRLKK